ncbi:MAG: hypothetical protein IPG76_00305 [Acidobacteria bacterium]|nr:hypothetical protein [Acidobacteriota bacterium]
MVGERYRHYQRLLGKKDIKVPDFHQSVGEESLLGRIEGGAADARSGLGLIAEESAQLDHLSASMTWTTVGGVAKGLAGVFHTQVQQLRMPQQRQTPVVDWLPVRSNIQAKLWMRSVPRSAPLPMFQALSPKIGKTVPRCRASWVMSRRDEWAFQSNQALKELQQIDRQILANEIREQITRKELENHIEQIEQAKSVDEFMRSKFSNDQLYQWMSGQLSGVYFSTYRMALDIARRAERAAARELGVKPLNIIRNDHWNNLRDGLLAGERLHQDLKRLEIAYIDQNRREYELVKHVSLKRLDPKQLIKLRTTGECTFEIPEGLFDLDTPGHYMRRLRSVSVSVPCVVGPYSGVSCKLTLLKSEVRHDPTGAYKQTDDDPRFTKYFGATESIVTSSGNDDSGLFETQLRDERYLPFEGQGAMSWWRLELPKDYKQFDYETISDVVLHLRFTAREGGESLRTAAVLAINTALAPPRNSQTTPLTFGVLFSAKSDFAVEWQQADQNHALRIKLDRQLLPYWMFAAQFVIKTFQYADISQDFPARVTWSQPQSPPRDGMVDLPTVGTGVHDRVLLLGVGKQ